VSHASTTEAPSAGNAIEALKCRVLWRSWARPSGSPRISMGYDEETSRWDLNRA
jgi:hypothetical protein